MSDIPLRTFGRSRNSRSGYAPLNTERDEYDGNENERVDGNNHQSMPLQTTATKATVSAARHNHQRWKGKKRQSYQDDPEEQQGLLGDGEGHDSEEEVGRPGPARRSTQEVRPTPPCYLIISHTEQRSTSRSTSSGKHAGGSKDKSRTVPFRPPGVF